jgi:DMSO/TMAO reductase YedYZ molybdopterin-dependent catalytic subunit
MTAATEPARPAPGRPLFGLFGILAAAAAVGAAQLAAALTRPTDSPVIAVGATFIDLTPVWLKDFAIRAFGTADKAVLLATIGAVLVGVAIGCGLLARRHLGWASAGIAGIGLVGAAAALSRPAAGLVAVVPSVVGAGVGVLALHLLVRSVRPPLDRVDDPSTPTTVRPTASRRTVLQGVLAVAAFAAVSGGIGSVMAGARAGVDRARNALRLPRPVDPAPPLPAGVASGVPGTTPFVVANADFYRVDTNLVVPAVDPATWQLTVGGMVDRPFTLSFDELLALPMVERDITLTCVSNEVGGQYAGNARWLGVRLTDLLDRAGIQPGADQLLATAVDGWTSSTPLAVATDGRDALVCVGMNGEPLPLEHGFPVRMLVPGLYGFISATKWLVSLEATTYAAQQAYWTQRGWATDAPIRTMARVEVPAPLSTVSPGPQMIAGTAWAQHRGIDGVEVQIDDGPWRPARLAAEASVDTWRQWSFRWDAPTGQHTLRARATDATGTTQPQARLDPFPSGAQGWHEVVVTVA